LSARRLENAGDPGGRGIDHPQQPAAQHIQRGDMNIDEVSDILYCELN
jgi:hypothetical protein